MADWYLDNAASGTNAGTSWTNAWESFADIDWGGGGVDAGDTLWISGGSTSKTYTDGQFTVGAGGSVGNPITISVSSEAGHNGNVVFDGGGSTNIGIYCYQNYVTFQGNVWQWRVQNYLTRFARSENTTGVTYDGVWMYESKEAGFYVRYNTDLTIIRCKIQTPSYDALVTDGIYSQGNTDSIYDGNWIGIYNSNPTPHCDCIQLYLDDGTIIRNNYAEQINDKVSNAQGLYGTDCTGHIQIYNNVVYNQNGNNCTAIRNIVGDATLSILNNTFKNGGYGAIIIGGSGDVGIPDPLIKNNIVWHMQTSEGYYCVKLYQWDGTASNINNNCMYAPGISAPFYVDGVGNRTWAQWQAAGYDANGMNVDPQVSAYPSFYPVSGSPCRNAGADLSGYFTTDKNGVTRPQGAGWDIGAFEAPFLTMDHSTRVRF